MKAPKNTAKEAQEQPILPLANAMLMGASESILHQEAQGQRAFVSSDVLPTKSGRYDANEGDWQQKLRERGVEFLGPVEGDELFQYVKLPTGWKKVPTDHSMWSELRDENDKVVAEIFYKAAFYDRDAFISLIEPH